MNSTAKATPPDPLVSDTKPSWQKVYSQSSVQERISGYVSGDSVQELSWYTWSIGAGWSQDSDYDRRRVKIITGGMTDPSSQTPYWGAETENQDVTLYKWGVDNRYYPSETASKTIGSFHTGAVYISTSDIQLEKVTYSVSMSAEAAISPSDYCKTATYSESSGKYTMKSGYGIQISGVVMGKIYTVDEITAAVKPIAEKYGIDKVWLFGSYARGEATEKSDVDLLISYQNLIGMFALGGVYSDMEDAFNKPVDIVSERALTASYASVSSKQLLMNARKDGIQIYGKKQ